MSDATDRQNVVRVRRVADGRWVARIGPDDDRGFEAIGSSGQSALDRLVFRLGAIGWTFDEPAAAFQSPSPEAGVSEVRRDV